MASIIKIVHYLNQFFGGIGSEESADVGVQTQAGPIGPGRLLQQTIDGRGQVVGTIICGDNQAAENWDTVSSQVEQAFIEFQPDVVMAGPAFDAGRYGIACARVCIVLFNLGCCDENQCQYRLIPDTGFRMPDVSEFHLQCIIEYPR